MSFSIRHPGWRCFITSLMEICEIVMNSKLLNNVSGHRYYGFFMLLITVIILSSLKCSRLVFVYIKLIFSLFKRQKQFTFRDREDVAHTWDHVFSPGCCFSIKTGKIDYVFVTTGLYGNWSLLWQRSWKVVWKYIFVF